MNHTETNPPRLCPQCNQPLPGDAPKGICPECLMAAGLETLPASDRTSSSSLILPIPGETFGNYEIIRELGSGGMGAVFEAKQLDTSRIVALKILNHKLDSPDARARFLREGRLAASINHPNSVYVYGTEEIDEMPAIAMELVVGSTLEEKVKTNGPMTVPEAVKTIIEVIDGLEAAAKIGILHRDVKPGNCFQENDGITKIGDFGLSISSDANSETQLTIDGAILGTPAFASPEQLRGEELNSRSDIYAVGATLYYLLTGKAPFQGKSVAQVFANVLEKEPPPPNELNSEIPNNLEKTILRCLEKTPGDRYHDYSELRTKLKSFEAILVVPASLLRRTGSNLIDNFAIFALLSIAHIAIYGVNHFFGDENSDLFLAGNALIALLYFSILEGKGLGTIGQWITGIRVQRLDKTTPGLLVSAFRGFAIMAVPSLIDLFYADSAYDDQLLHPATLFAPIYLLIIFSSVRKHNGLASLIDLWTRTRVTKTTHQSSRSPLLQPDLKPLEPDTAGRKIGPFPVLESMGCIDGSEWVVGYDTRLLRKVWIRIVQAGTPPVDETIRRSGRIGKLRWLTGKRDDQENWDSFEAPGGASLQSLIDTDQVTLDQARYWLLDITEELEAAEKDGDPHQFYSTDLVWITDQGRAKLLDYPMPGAGNQTGQSAADLLMTILQAAKSKGPLPLYTSAVTKTAIEKQGSNLFRNLINRKTTIGARQRLGIIAATMATPIIGFLSTSFTMQHLYEDKDYLTDTALIHIFEMQYNESIDTLKKMAQPHGSKEIDKPKDPVSPSSNSSFSFDDQSREQLFQSILQSPDFPKDDFENPEITINLAITAVEKEIQENQNKLSSPFSFLYALIMGAMIPAILAAAFLGKGAIMRMIGIAIVNPDNTEASRGKTLLRSLIGWSPAWLSYAWYLWLPYNWIAGCIILTVLIGFAIGYVCFQQRSIQDRIVNTYLVRQ